MGQLTHLCLHSIDGSLATRKGVKGTSITAWGDPIVKVTSVETEIIDQHALPALSKQKKNLVIDIFTDIITKI